MTRKMSSFILKSKAPTSLMGAAKAVCQAPLFFAKTLAISGIQPTTMFCLVATLCENGGTLEVMVRLEDTSVPHVIPHLVLRPTARRCPRFNLNFSMWVWPNFMTFQHGQPFIELVLSMGLWLCTMKKEWFSCGEHQHADIGPLECCWILVFNH
jgi:hypothetical protein